MRVLLLTYHFTPSSAIGAARTTSLAKYLVAHGHEVRVIAGEASKASVGQASKDDGVVVQRIPHQLGLVARAVSRVRGKASLASAAINALPASPVSRGRASELVSLVGRSVFNLPDPSMPWARKAFHVGVGITLDWRPDAIVVSGPPFSSFIAASRLARRLKVSWVADYRDLWSNSTYYPYPTPRRAVDKFLERITLRGAAALVTVSAPLADDLGRFHNRRADVVLNGHEPNCIGEGLQERLAGRLTLFYAGQLYAGRRDPTPLFEAIALLGNEGASIRVHFAGPHGALAKESARRAGCGDSVVDHGQIERADALLLQHRADVLLLLMWNDVGEVGVYSGKLFEYLFARRPILMLGWPHGVAAELIRSRGAGVVLNDPVAIAHQLRSWLAADASTGGISPLPSSVTDGLTRDEQNRRFARVIERAARR